MADLLPPFPVHDQALDAIEHALGAALDGDNNVVGADFTLSRLLDFYSGYDPADSVLDGYAGDVPVYLHTKPCYSEHDVIRALIAEVRRLRWEASDG